MSKTNATIRKAIRMEMHSPIRFNRFILSLMNDRGWVTERRGFSLGPGHARKRPSFTDET
jgi:hypothetical protein